MLSAARLLPANPNARGALLMAITMSAFTANDIFMKLAGQTMPLFQALFLRSIGTCIFLAVVVWATGGFSYRMSGRDMRLTLLRSLAEVAAAFTYLTALFNMPVANATAILQALPLTVTLTAAFFLREPIGWRRLLASGVGLGGVLLIIRPGVEGFNAYSLLAFLAVGCVTLRDLTARRLSADVPSSLVAFGAVLAVLIFSGVGAATVEWAPLNRANLSALGAAVLLVVLGYILSVAAMRSGEVAFVTLFRYTSLLVGLLLGLLVFGEWPRITALLGAGVIVGAGVFTLLRERRLRAASLAAASGRGIGAAAGE